MANATERFRQGIQDVPCPSWVRITVSDQKDQLRQTATAEFTESGRTVRIKLLATKQEEKIFRKLYGDESSLVTVVVQERHDPKTIRGLVLAELGRVRKK